MILENGLIRTLDPQVPTQRALAVAGDRIAGGVGVHETALASPEVVDLGGRVVVPGFTDSHVHFPTWALAQHEVNLDGCASLEEALGRLHGVAPGPGGWLRGYGWRSGDWQPSREPTRHDLDPITGDTPAGLIAKDYHSLWLNSAALALANGNLDVAGGVVERDENGEPTGVLREESAWRFKEQHMLVSDDAYLEAMRAGVRLANSRGVTSVHDKDGWLGALRLWRKLEERGQLSLRVWQSIPADLVDAAAAVGLRSGLGSPMLRIGYLKVFMDGTLGSQTAWMLDGSGVQITSGPELAEIVRRGAVAGFQVAVHAIGDRANAMLVGFYERAIALHGPRDRRFRIEHAQHLRPQEIQKIGALGIIPSMQPYHAIDDGRWAAHRLDTARLRGTYAFRSLVNARARLAFGSDWTVAPLDPLQGIYAAVTRRTLDGLNPGGWFPEQKLTVEEALRAYTNGVAYAGFLDDRTGILRPGMLADIVVLDRDLFRIPPEEIAQAHVVATIVGGTVVYDRR